MENSRTCDFCNVDVHTASFAKHLKSKKHLGKIKAIDLIMVISEWLFQKPNESVNNIPRTIYNPRPFQEIAREIIKIGDKKLNTEIAKKMKNPYYFTDKVLKVRVNFTLDSHPINHAIYILTIKPNYPEIGTRYVNKLLREMATVYARLINQYK